MELGKLLIFGVLGLLVLNLWNGSEPTRIAATSQETEPEAEGSEALPHVSDASTQPAAVAHVYQSNDGYPSPYPDNDDIETDLDRHATYDYVRERDSGTSNTYSYHVEGYDEFGTEVEGSVNTRGVYGKGYVTTEDGEHHWIDTKWLPSGELLGFDRDGVTYRLETSAIR